MRKPKCCICGRDIEANEHYYLINRRSVCKTCEAKLRPELNKRERVRIIREKE
jgi:hypothetical protein